MTKFTCWQSHRRATCTFIVSLAAIFLFCSWSFVNQNFVSRKLLLFNQKINLVPLVSEQSEIATVNAGEKLDSYKAIASATPNPFATTTEQLENLNNLLETLRQVIPNKFLPTFKNPCWYGIRGPGTNSTLLNCLPYFILLGIPKCGSSKVWKILSTHQDFAYPRAKEVNIGSYRSLFPPIQNITSYLNHFDKAVTKIRDEPSEAITGDGTPTTMFLRPYGIASNKTPIDGLPRLYRELLPNTKFIVVVRDPIDVVRSHFYYLRRICKVYNSEKDVETEMERLHVVVEDNIRAYNDCVSYYGNDTMCLLTQFHKKWLRGRKCGIFSMEFSVPFLSLSFWMKYFPPEQFFVFTNKELLESPIPLAHKMFSFLDMSPLTPQKLASLQAMASSRANSVSFLHKDNNEYSYVADKTVRLLKQFFAPFNQKLANLLGKESIFE